VGSSWDPITQDERRQQPAKRDGTEEVGDYDGGERAEPHGSRAGGIREPSVGAREVVGNLAGCGRGCVAMIWRVGRSVLDGSYSGRRCFRFIVAAISANRDVAAFLIHGFDRVNRLFVRGVVLADALGGEAGQKQVLQAIVVAVVLDPRRGQAGIASVGGQRFLE